MIPQRHSKEHLKAEGREMEEEKMRCFLPFFFPFFFFLPLPEERRFGRDFKLD